MKLTDTLAAGLTLDGRADRIVFDEDLPGFGVRLRASGARTWIAQYRAAGGSRRMLIGPTSKVTAKQARKRAQEILAQVVLGGDPQAAKASARSAGKITLSVVAEEYLAAKLASLRPASFRVTALYLRGPHFRALHGVPLADISLSDVAAALLKVTREHGGASAVGARAALSAAFKWAMQQGLASSNPVIGTVTKTGPSRDRVLTDRELSLIWGTCGDDDGGRVVRLLILTAARRQEIGGLCWQELDASAGTWVLPAARSKNGRQHVLPLPPAAWAIIDTVPQVIGRAHLFGSHAANGFTGWSGLKRGLDAALGDQVESWCYHDLRRTCATRMADLGIMPHVIEEVLGHSVGTRVSRTYIRSRHHLEVRAALALWADHVTALVDGTERRVLAFERPAAS